MPTNRAIRFALPALATGLLGFAIIASLRPGRAQTEPLLAPQASPFASGVAGIGVIEPSSELIAIATELPGVVRSVHVKAGDSVPARAALFTLDARALTAQLASAKAGVDQAQAALVAANVRLEDERQRLGLFEAVSDPRAISQDELARRQFAAREAEAASQQARAAVALAQAQQLIVATDLERLTVRAPIAGKIWRVNARPGEFAPAGPLAQPLLTMGAGEVLHVRVEIDETDIGRVRRDAKAMGALRGAAQTPIPLRFVRFEPEAVEKRALAGGAERVDSRVIEIIYAFDPVGGRDSTGQTSTREAFIGQRMDVSIEGAALPFAAKPKDKAS